ncbi:MAG: hypothetical protein O3B46_06670 [Bacteroidetes bacterium]|nr:hypothetical protein [Bacteroidota bacterium]MDA0922896.1 hypothetical protein [Bacteroidota bacterium]MDA1289102.1 hypothetical protein [Bacteroidota bacterium]
MKYVMVFLMVVSGFMVVFNLSQIDWNQPLIGDSSIAVIGILASASAFVLLLILSLARKIAKQIKK